jgi:hypothetical protein
MYIPLIEAAKSAKSFVAVRFHMWKFANHCDRRFRCDARYNLQAVSDGFAPRIQDSDDDSELLARISEAYIRAANQQKFGPVVYRPTESWQQTRQGSLKPMIEALLSRNVGALRRMFQNFYRDPCSSGLLGVPNGMAKAYFGREIKDVYRRFYLGHVLYRLDYWEEQTAGRFAARDLAGPGLGNPFGVVVEGTHIAVGAEYNHYCAHRIGGLLDPENYATVAEIGGGFGGMAYYLLRDRPGTTYLDFDSPERIALASYYLLKAFPKLKVLLYGEGNLTSQKLAQADIVLMPAFCLPDMPAGRVDLTFSSHSIAKAGPETIAEYLRQFDRITRGSFLCIADKKGADVISSLMNLKFSSLTMEEMRNSGWFSYKVSGAGVGGARHVGDSAVLEQVYTRRQARNGLERGLSAGELTKC